MHPQTLPVYDLPCRPSYPLPCESLILTPRNHWGPSLPCRSSVLSTSFRTSPILQTYGSVPVLLFCFHPYFLSYLRLRSRPQNHVPSVPLTLSGSFSILSRLPVTFSRFLFLG